MDALPFRRMMGFTIAEFVMVIALVGILAAFALPRWIGSEVALSAQAEALAGDIRFTQSLAMTQGTHYRLNLLTSNTYSITTSAGGAVLNPSKGTNIVTLNDSVLFGSFTGLPSNLIAFNGQGVPYTDSAATTTALASTAVIPMTVNGVTCNIQIIQSTGKVTVSC